MVLDLLNVPHDKALNPYSYSPISSCLLPLYQKKNIVLILFILHLSPKWEPSLHHSLLHFILTTIVWIRLCRDSVTGPRSSSDFIWHKFRLKSGSSGSSLTLLTIIPVVLQIRPRSICSKTEIKLSYESMVFTSYCVKCTMDWTFLYFIQLTLWNCGTNSTYMHKY